MFETYTQRQRRLRGESIDVFIYDQIPDSLRVHIIQIWRKAIGEPTIKGSYTVAYETYEDIHEALSAEFGVFRLGPKGNHYAALTTYLMQCNELNYLLDIIDFTFRTITELPLNASWRVVYQREAITAKQAVDWLNARFLQHGVGYQFILGSEPQLIRKDNEHVHKETVIPALQLLHDHAFDGANEEYRSAHKHYRHGRIDECLTDCLKSFESAMKTICNRCGWPLPEKPVASVLIKTCLKNGLLGEFMEQHLGNFQAALESGVPTVRNRLGAHGQGETFTEVPSFYAEYMISETAVNLVLLINAYKALPRK